MKKQICSSCGKVGYPVLTTKGSCLIELILWLFLIVPGLIYTVWRRSKVPVVCSSCRNETMIPLDSPVAQKMIADRPELMELEAENEIPPAFIG
jgi:hypothetical protein